MNYDQTISSKGSNQYQYIYMHEDSCWCSSVHTQCHAIHVIKPHATLSKELLTATTEHWVRLRNNQLIPYLSAHAIQPVQIVLQDYSVTAQCGFANPVCDPGVEWSMASV